MRFTLLATQPKTYAVIFETGDELASGLSRFATEQKLAGSSFKAIGAVSSVKLAWLDWKTKQYRPSVDLNEQMESRFADRRCGAQGWQAAGPRACRGGQVRWHCAWRPSAGGAHPAYL